MWPAWSCLMAEQKIIAHRFLGEVEVVDDPAVDGRFFFNPSSRELVGYESKVYVEMRREQFNEKYIPPFGEFVKEE